MEMDFENEAANSRRCAADLADLPGVIVPKVFDRYTSKRVLTAEFIHGCKANDRKVWHIVRRNLSPFQIGAYFVGCRLSRRWVST